MRDSRGKGGSCCGFSSLLYISPTWSCFLHNLVVLVRARRKAHLLPQFSGMGIRTYRRHNFLNMAFPTASIPLLPPPKVPHIPPLLPPPLFSCSLWCLTGFLSLLSKLTWLHANTFPSFLATHLRIARRE